jgi:poly-beta-1,6-N-acetyl-D-glucosamine synthase
VAIFVLLLILLSLLYAGLFTAYYKGWHAVPIYPLPTNYTCKHTVSIILPARNEEQFIIACIDSILQQQYNGTFELIVINDHSTDATATLLASYGTAIKVIHLSDMPQVTTAYKKQAIATAIQQASGNLILTTDADTIRGKLWLQSMVSFYEQHNYKIVAGPVNYISNGKLLNTFQVIDFATMQGITAASLQLNLGSTCNGANLLYSKQAFNEVGGFNDIQHIASGDDMLLMHKIEKKYPQGAGYIKCTEAIVSTYAMPTLTMLVQQRIRWASKSKHYKHIKLNAILVIFGLYNLALLCLLLLFYKGAFTFIGLLLILAIKVFAEYKLVEPVLAFFGHKQLSKWHIILQPLHICYVVYCGVLGMLTTYKWKGREVR